MKPLHRTILATACALAFAAPASAITFYDVDSLGGIELQASRGIAEVSGTFDVTAAGIEGDSYDIWLPYALFPQTHSDVGGFEVGVHSAYEATFELFVRDDFDPFSAERLVVDLGGAQGAGPIEVDFGIESIGVEATLLATIDATGQLDYTITATQGDFYVDYVALTVQAELAGGPAPPAAPPIPEVGSLSAYAVGTLLTAGYVRRRRRA